MSVAKVQSTTQPPNGVTSQAIALTGVTAGNLLVLVVKYFDGTQATNATPATPTDSNGTPAVAIAPLSVLSLGGQMGCAIFYVANAAAGTHTFTVNPFNNANAFSGFLTLMEFSGVATASPLDTAAVISADIENAASTTTFNTTAGAALAQADELIVAAISVTAGAGEANAGISTPTTGYTQVSIQQDTAANVGGEAAFKETATTTGQIATWTFTSDPSMRGVQAALVAFKAAAGGGGGGTPASAYSTSGWGPGIQPNARAQFRAAPRAILIPPPPVTALAAVANSYAAASAALSSLITSGGLGYVSQPGPGVGPFSNNQFQTAPRATVAPGPQFLMAASAGCLASVSASLSALQAWAASGNSIASGTADLATLRGSGGAIGYLSHSGPGIGPSTVTQFTTPPRSTKGSFAALVGAAQGAGQSQGAANLLTSILMATDVPGAVRLVTEGGDGIGLLVSSPMRGMATAMAALTTGINLAASANAAANAASALTAAAQMAAVGGAVASAAAAPNTGIVLAATVTGLSYATAALGSGTSLTVTAAGLASASAGLVTQSLLSASSSGFASASAALASGPQFATNAAATASALAGLSTSILVSAQAVGLASATAALSGSVIVSVSASGVAIATAALATASRLNVQGNATASANAALSTAVAPYSAFAQGSASASANLNGNITLAANASCISSVTARLLTVLQPPGEFADIRWLRAPRGADVAYAEFFQGVGEQLWYGVNWEDWLASNWEANSSATLGQALRPSIPNGLEFVCITAGQTGAVEPLWPTYAGGVVVDGTAMWQGQAVTSVSLDDTISGSSFNAPSGVTLDSGQVLLQRSYLIIESLAAVVGTDYDVLCTIYTTGGQQKIAKLRIKIR